MTLRRVFQPMLLGVLVLLLAAALSPFGGVAAAQSNATVHYIYADNGLCPDTISGFQISGKKLVPTPGSPYSAGPTSCTETAVFGYNALAATPTNSVHGPCLVHSDGDQPQVESFSIDPATGALALVSTLVLNSDPTAQAKDIRIASNGNLVYVTVLPGSAQGSLASLALGAGCALKIDQQFPVPTKDYNSILLISPSRLVAIAFSQQGIDTYALTPNGGIKFVNSVSGQISGTDGVAAQTFKSPSGQRITNLYTGQFRLGIQQGSEAQGGQYTPSTGAFSPLPTSPITDPDGLSLDYLLFNTAHHYLIGTESFSESLGVWSAQGSGFSFFGHVRLPDVASSPSAMAQLGSQLFVVARSVIFRCTITSVAPGLQNCAVVANLNGVAIEGVAIL